MIRPILAILALAAAFGAGRWSAGSAPAPSASPPLAPAPTAGKRHGKRKTARTIAPPPAGSPVAQTEARAARAQDKPPALPAATGAK